MAFFPLVTQTKRREANLSLESKSEGTILYVCAINIRLQRVIIQKAEWDSQKHFGVYSHC